MLKGTLDDFTLPDMFRLMSFAKKTGRLDVERRAGHGSVFFREGEVYYAESSLTKIPLGQKLLRAGVITESQLNKALDANAESGERVGEILLQTGVVDGEQLEAALRAQIEDAVFDLLRWDLGEFSWEPDAAVDPEVGIMVSVENLIMEASRRLDELEVITRKIPSGRTVLKMADKPPEGAVEINITPEEWRILVLVDGTRTVAQIGDLVGLDEFDAMRTLYGLVSAGLIEVDMTAEPDGEEGAEAPATRAEEEPATEAVEEPAPADDTEEEAAEPQDEGRTDEDDPEVDSAPAPPEALEAEPALDENLEVDSPTPADATSGSPGADLIAEQALEEATSFDDSAFDAEAQAVAEAFGDAAQDPADELVHQSSDQLDPSELVQGDVEQDPADELVHQASGQLDPSELMQGSDDSGDDASPKTVLDSWFVEPALAEDPLVDNADADSFGDPAVPADSFDEPAPGEMDKHEPPSPADSILNDLLGELPAEAPLPVRGEGDAPDAPLPPVGDTPEPPSDAPRVDRAAVVRELAGLFGGEEEQRPRPRATSSSSRPAEPEAPQEAVDGDQRKRVEDDDQVNRGLISRLIDGVKGL